MASALEQKARQVVDSLADRPGLMFEILRLVADEYEVVGPWETSGQSHVRFTVNRMVIAEVLLTPPSANPGGWQWQTTDGTAGSEATAQEAMDAADAVLHGQGVLLG